MTLRVREAESIRAFVELAGGDGLLSGRVLDYGCGQQPYRDIVEKAGGHYEGFDRAIFPGNVSITDVGDWEEMFFDANAWDTILCTQVVQYVPFPELTELLSWWAAEKLFRGGHLILTYPTNWPEVEFADLHRFTKAGMHKMLEQAGFTIIRHDFRHGFQHDGVSFACGYGVVARA